MEHSKNQLTLKNSQMLQEKQEGTLIKYVENQEEYNFNLAFYNRTIKQYSNNEHIDTLIGLLAKWRWMSGVSASNQDEDEIAQELALISKFVITNYPNLTLEEISLAIDLSLTEKLDCDVKTYNTFTPMYVSRILNAYKQYKFELYNKLKQKETLAKQKIENEKKLSPQEKMDATIDLINYFYEQYNSSGEVNDLFNTVYSFLKRTNNIKINKQLIDEAMIYGTEKANALFNKQYDVLFNKNKFDTDYWQKHHARNYCVSKLFSKIKIEELISKIKLEDFV